MAEPTDPQQQPIRFSHDWGGKQLITVPTAEQQIRMEAGRITVGLLAQALREADLGEVEIVDVFLAQAGRIAAWLTEAPTDTTESADVRST